MSYGYSMTCSCTVDICIAAAIPSFPVTHFVSTNSLIYTAFNMQRAHPSIHFISCVVFAGMSSPPCREVPTCSRQCYAKGSGWSWVIQCRSRILLPRC